MSLSEMNLDVPAVDGQRNIFPVQQKHASHLRDHRGRPNAMEWSTTANRGSYTWPRCKKAVPQMTSSTRHTSAQLPKTGMRGGRVRKIAGVIGSDCKQPRELHLPVQKPVMAMACQHPFRSAISSNLICDY